LSLVPIANQVFVAMPFAPRFDPVWGAIRDVCRGASLFAYRVDQLPVPGDLTRQILDGIRESAFVVADLTGNNLNVAFEVGYAAALGKDLVLLSEDVAALPFDVRNLRAIAYAREPPGLFELRRQLALVIELILARGAGS